MNMHRGSGRHKYDGKIAGLYDLEETLGRGHFAVVKLARHVFTGEKVAVKVIDKSKLDEVSRAHLFQEVRCMKLVQHPNVVRLYEVIDTQTKLYLILELADGGDLYDYIMRHEGGLDENVAREYFRQIVRAISYCHRLHVVHRDLKPENVVFFEQLGMVKLTDFGFSNRFNPGQKLETSCGSLAYSAPEILLGDSYDAPAVDVWSLGVILFMLVCGQAPFQEANDSETLTMIMDCKYTVPVHVSDECKRLIARMLIREPDKRATLEQIASDPWLGEDLNAEPADFLPLISREHVSDDDHSLIIQKMVNGNIASKEEILDALDRNEYNYMTATYFLLAERKLRSHRQEQAQMQLKVKRAQLSPVDPRMPFTKGESNIGEEQDSNAAINKSLLTVSRSPGDLPQNYRARKCSIVQEEEDEDDMSTCTGREELVPPNGSLNRRGSRSEGKLNLALQERLAESERRKEKAIIIKQKSPLCHGGITRVGVRDDNANAGLTNRPIKTPIIKLTPSTTVNSKPLTSMDTSSPQPRPVATKPPALTMTRKSFSTSTSTSVITQSSTITIPLHPSQGPSLLPKYKTMPSPTRPVHSALNAQLALNEIFEEVDTISGETLGQKSSTHGFVGRSRISSAGSNYEQRRSKFSKSSRTASCSSSDASDDDSESRKKRAHKIASSSSKPLSQRRDSHDDSSDSQDQGSGGTGGGTCGSSRTGNAEHNTTGPTSSRVAGVSEGSRTNNGSEGSRKHSSENVQSVTFTKRHRNGRRRSSETRLRESQSLNRITEVQEAEQHSVQNCHVHSTTVVVTSSTSTVTRSTSSYPKPRGIGARLLQSWSLTSGSKKHTVLEEKNTENKDSNHSIEEGKNLKDRCKIKVPNSSVTGGSESSLSYTKSGNVGSKSGLVSASHVSVEEKENLCKVSKIKIVHEKQSSVSGKKVRLLSRYFQSHKKLCLPLPGLFGRGRLYKAQSCSSIVRDRITPSSAISLHPHTDGKWHIANGKTGAVDDMWVNGNNMSLANIKALDANNDKAGDINRNLGISGTVATTDNVMSLGAVCPGIRMCHIHLTDASKCCHLC